MIKHLEAKKILVEGPSRGPDSEIGSDNTTARLQTRLQVSVAATTITKSHADLLPRIKVAQEMNFLASKIDPTLDDVSIADVIELRSIDLAITKERRIYVPAELRS